LSDVWKAGAGGRWGGGGGEGVIQRSTSVVVNCREAGPLERRMCRIFLLLFWERGGCGGFFFRSDVRIYSQLMSHAMMRGGEQTRSSDTQRFIVHGFVVVRCDEMR
jgi:hypothetical protein